MKLLLATILIFYSLNIWALDLFEKHNFSVVINNEIYQIYRSKYLGTDGVESLFNELDKLSIPIPKTIIYMNDDGYKGDPEGKTTKKNYAIQEYFDQKRFGYTFYHSFDYQKRVYLDGKNPYKPSSDIDKKKKLGPIAIDSFGEAPSDGKDGGVDNLLRILDTVLDPDLSPILFHCKAGRHRTGMVAMILRYLQDLEYYGQVINPNDTTYNTRAEVEYLEHIGSRRKARKKNVTFVRQFITSETFKVYQKKYGRLLNR